MLEELHKLYREVKAEGFGKIIDRRKKYNVTLGKNVRVISAGDGESFTGKSYKINGSKLK